ncbi:MAG TPA: DUF1217 domain-containing protein [Acetobacteraceae bacterium]|nr:DUF1217 domain-containing protein [Acetobacteraceae bacterium]
MSDSFSYLPSLFTGLFPASSTGASSLLGILYGSGSQATNGTGQNPINALQQAEQNETQDVKLTAAQPAEARDIAAFVTAVQTATTPQQLLDNPTAMKVLLTANGLGDQVQYTALAQKTLLSNVDDSKSLANTLSDTRWKSAVQTYDFANKGLSIIQNPDVINTITNAYAEVSWRQSLDATTPGLSDALAFRANAASVSSVDQILGDPLLRRVVTTALGIPLQIAFQPLEAQETAITNRLDISQLQDPKFVDKFAQRYLLAAANSSSSTRTPLGLVALAVQARSLVV